MKNLILFAFLLFGARAFADQTNDTLSVICRDSKTKQLTAAVTGAYVEIQDGKIRVYTKSPQSRDLQLTHEFSSDCSVEQLVRNDLDGSELY